MASSVDERRIAEIVQRVMADLHPQTAPGQPAATTTPVGLASQAPGLDGVYPDVDAAIAAARVGQERLAELPLERRSALIAAMRQAAMENAPALARAASASAR